MGVGGRVTVAVGVGAVVTAASDSAVASGVAEVAQAVKTNRANNRQIKN